MTRFGLGIDVGGTFTDIVVYDAATGRQASHKELTTHADPSRGVMAGIDRLLRRERRLRLPTSAAWCMPPRCSPTP